MQPTLFTATYSAGRAEEAPRPAAPLGMPRTKPVALVAIVHTTAESFRSFRSAKTARAR